MVDKIENWNFLNIELNLFFIFSEKFVTKTAIKSKDMGKILSCTKVSKVIKQFKKLHSNRYCLKSCNEQVLMIRRYILHWCISFAFYDWYHTYNQGRIYRGVQGGATPWGNSLLLGTPLGLRHPLEIFLARTRKKKRNRSNFHILA